MNRVGIFLDRDGTIIKEVDYLRSPSQIQLIAESSEAIRIANKLGLHLFIVTNQSGIARGLLTEQELEIIHQNLMAQLKSQGAKIDGLYYCPHHPEVGSDKYRIDCECRKPKTGMLRQASKDHGIDLSRSFVVGDKMIDIQTGNNCGASTILVLTGYGEEELKICRLNKIHIDYVAANLIDAVQYIQEIINKEQPQTATIKTS
ncbi:MAG: D,D-heptose 1,7-bisphosphate phosphatase [Chlorobiaceae bacterium]|nr:D,D-heptose 1,7-bisphosphate phosphatase [Chlorobiaceae bacterium]